MSLRILFVVIIITGLSACDAAEIDRICEPQLTRQFNIIYNAHFRGDLHFNNTCNDTAYVLRTETPTDTVLPGNNRSYLLLQGEQYLVNVACNDSTHTYNFVNQCP